MARMRVAKWARSASSISARNWFALISAVTANRKLPFMMDALQLHTWVQDPTCRERC